MRWDEGHESEDVIDRRGERGGGDGGGARLGLLGFIPLVLRFRYGWVLVLLLIGGSYVGKATGLFGVTSQSQGVSTPTPLGAKATDKQARFVSFVLDDNQTTWKRELGKRGKRYDNAKLVLFSGSTQTACGRGMAATGPFYCPSDARVYIDLAFYEELEKRLGARGDFAQAYVIAHEIGHHVQDLLGTSDAVHSASAAQQKGADGLSVRLELQADCFAGVWGHDAKARGILEAGDIDEALTAASAIGDDRLQQQAGGRVRPETWTHGSSAQRSQAFKTGFETGRMESCDTFGRRP
jgi:predicted metalloprotease